MALADVVGIQRIVLAVEAGTGNVRVNVSIAAKEFALSTVGCEMLYRNAYRAASIAAFAVGTV